MINVFGANVGQEELSVISSCFDNSWMGMGKQVELFEKRLSKRLGIDDLVMLSSGSDALLLAIKLLNLPLGSKIILPSFTFVACANAIILAGHIPVFADVDWETQNITEKTVAKVIDHHVKAIMVVHYAGLPVDIDSLTFGLPIIEDSAHAIDSKYKGKSCGAIGDIGIYSFDSVKNLPTPEGGAIVGSEEILKRAREFRYSGINKTGYFNMEQEKWWEYDIKNIWHKMIPNDISASIGISQLDKLDVHQKRRKEIWDIYQKELKVENPTDAKKGDRHSYFTYLIKVKKRNELARYLLENEVFTTLKFHPLHLNAIYKQNVSLPITEKLNEVALNIPIHPKLTDNDIDKVINLINNFK